jgi:hypothetical protein
MVFIVACYRAFKVLGQATISSRVGNKAINSSSNITITKQYLVYLLGSFFPTFFLFSATTFQLDHYTNILMPFASILCAWYMMSLYRCTDLKTSPIYYFQIWLAVILTLVVIGLSIFIFGHTWFLVIGLVGLVMVLIYIVFTQADDFLKAIFYPSLAISLTFIFLMLINGKIYAKYDVGYQIATRLNTLNPLPVVDYKINSLTLEFHTKGQYIQVNDLTKLARQVNKPYYLVVPESSLAHVVEDVPSARVLFILKGTTIDKVMKYLLARPRLNEALTSYIVLEVK